MSKSRTFTLRRDAQHKINELINNGISFTVSRTQNSCKIIIPKRNEVYFKGSGNYSFVEMNNQRSLKKKVHENIIKNEMVVPEITQNDISYFKYGKYLLNEMPFDSPMTDFVEFDIAKAYYKMAYNLGYIDEEMYQEYINLKKDVRLRFLGSIATKKRFYEYKKGKLATEPIIKEDRILRKVWFHICKETDNCLAELMEAVGDNFIMYYVDGIYLKKGDYTEIINRISEKHKVDFVQEKVRSITKTWDDNSKAIKIIITKFNVKKNTYVPKEFTVRSVESLQNAEYKEILRENEIK